MEREAQPRRHQGSWVTLLGCSDPSGTTGILTEGRKSCRKPELSSSPLPFSAGEAPSLPRGSWLGLEPLRAGEELHCDGCWVGANGGQPPAHTAF